MALYSRWTGPKSTRHWLTMYLPSTYSLSFSSIYCSARSSMRAFRDLLITVSQTWIKPVVLPGINEVVYLRALKLVITSFVFWPEKTSRESNQGGRIVECRGKRGYFEEGVYIYLIYSSIRSVFDHAFGLNIT